MILDIDAGNSLVKWRLRDNGKVLARGNHETVAVAAGETLVLPETAIVREVRLANVAGPQVKTVLKKQFPGLLKMAQVSSQVGSVTCGYDNPERLGIDRWLALLAAYHQFQQALLVIDAGSAITVDILDSEGQHLGGYVVPGLRLMASALWNGTQDVKVNATDFQNMLIPGKNSQQAVERSCVLVAVAAVEKLVSHYPVRILITGGDAEPLIGAVSFNLTHCPDLVLDGLAIAGIHFTE